MAKKIIILLIFLTVVTGGVYFLKNIYGLTGPLSGLARVAKPKPLMAYTFTNLQSTRFPQSEIVLGRKISETDNSVSRVFYFEVPKTPKSDVLQKASGLINLPKKPGTYPVIIMFRGYVDENIYQPGVGTQRAAEVYAKNGFITLAPDFLGYGESASPSADPFENRFQTYTTALSLLASVPTLNTGLSASYSGILKADTEKIGIWGHSNGGHIALSVLAISGENYPTVLWAPVSKSFPYSILYYTDETDDQGKELRRVLSKFEATYDTELFSPPNYYHRITAPLDIFQGEADEEVPPWWTRDLVATLKKDGLDVKYTVYPNADHNLMPTGWSDAVLQSTAYYANHLK
jgi:dipeptidyl aminopeptidase/acylaminoacyl peptidase